MVLAVEMPDTRWYSKTARKGPVKERSVTQKIR